MQATAASGVSVDNDESSARINIRALLRLNEPQVDVDLECAVQFSFGDHTVKLPIEDAITFATGSGIDYVMGYIRGALADATRSVGLPAMTMPTQVPEGLLIQIEQALRHDDAAEGKN
ncbi:hypothetical protein [Mycobacteroides franklinii]|uniref:hypothetical protein n=1 Tax=Mycobacteroides franklinii TaxID=948102 RepID=UPI0013E8B2C3|nr:hypothetical protein [Mycobacteroides franklinii]